MRNLIAIVAAGAGALLLSVPAHSEVIYAITTPYHHIRVIDEGGMRSLNFDDTMQSRMSLADPLQGHFEYVEYFFAPWLWNPNLTNVLMLGLGGGSAQRLYQHYAPSVTIDTVEIDPYVVRVARDYFGVKPSATHRIHESDGRVFLRRSTTRYDVIVADAYVSGRYGCTLPQHLATKEFFALADDHLSTNGVLAYNVVGTMRGAQASLVGALYRTMKTVFPQVYLFPARESQNVVLVATKAKYKVSLESARWKAAQLTRAKKVTLPGFLGRVGVFWSDPPKSYQQSPVLTDDFAPVEGLAKMPE